MSEQQDFGKYLRGEYYPGTPKTPWRIAMEADFEKRGVSFNSRPVPKKKIPVLVEMRLRKQLINGRVAK